MGDDPYDFDISLPTEKEKSAYGGSARFRDGADDSGSESGGSNRSRSGTGSESSGSDSDDSKRRDSKVPARVTTAAPVRAGVGSSALDKAKSFLSKYSTKTAVKDSGTAKSSRSRRLEMSLDDEDFSLDSSGEEVRKPSLDDEDFSLDSSGEEVRKPKATMTKAATATGRKTKETSGSEDDARLEAEMDGSEGSSEHAGESDSHDESESEQEDERRRSEKPETSDHREATTVTSTSVAPRQFTAARTADDDVDSVASQSEEEESVDERRSAPNPAPDAQHGRAREISTVSESGVYEEEDFEPDSMADDHPKSTKEIARGLVGRGKDEDSNFDYSLEFTEDAESSPLPYTPGLDPVTGSIPLPVITENVDPTRQEKYSPASSRSSKSNRNSYVDEDGDAEDGEVAKTGHTCVSEHQSEDYSYDNRFESESTLQVPTLNQVLITPDKSSHAAVAADEYTWSTTAIPMTDSMTRTYKEGDTVKSEEQTQPLASNETRSKPIAQSALISNSVQPTMAGSPTVVRSIVIVREYEQPRGSVEKRDAATQFTGNHASIQADLVPYGMLTSSEKPENRNGSPDPPHIDDAREPAREQPPRRNVEASPADSETVPPSPPPPPAFSTYGLYDPLQLPVATSMSIYKQQLLALQQQIQQKKLETERLFRDRLAARYSTLRGTDRFLQANRPSRMPLWEALQRVDPSLDESKAKEVARMVNESSSA